MSPMEPSTTTTSNIPNDIVIDILIRVPAKSLLRLRWACKYWFDLITRDHDFTNMHLHSSTTNQDFSVLFSNVISRRTGVTGQLLQCSFVNCYNNNNNTESSLEITDFTSIQTTFWFFKVGYCNGLLVCPSLTRDDRVCIWNPCTQEYKLLPDPPPPTTKRQQLGGDAGSKIEYCTYGIGYDRTIDDYKITRNAYYYDHFYNNFLALNALVYTLETNSWRSIEPCPYRLDPLAAVFVNGALYNWVYDCPETKIISFDIAKEKYKEMSKLPECTQGNVRRRTLHVFEGCLCMLLLSMNDLTGAYYMEMWVMKNDHGMNNSEEDSWTMLFKCQNPLYDNYWMKPVRFTKNREILMLARQKLILCDPKSNTIRTVSSICKEEHHISEIVVYIESLVSLNSGTYFKGRTEHKPNDEDNDADDVTYFKTTMEQYLKC